MTKQRLADNVIFDPERHIYSRITGEIIPSVTQIIAGAGLIDTTWYEEGSASKGTEIHKMLELIDSYRLDWGSVPEKYYGYITAWEKFKKENEVEIKEIESLCCDDYFRYAGRIDRIVTCRKEEWVIDIKTGCKEKWHKIQVGGYCKTTEIKEGGCVYLKADGKYEFVRHEINEGYSLFDACLKIYNFKGVKK